MRNRVKQFPAQAKNAMASVRGVVFKTQAFGDLTPEDADYNRGDKKEGVVCPDLRLSVTISG